MNKWCIDFIISEKVLLLLFTWELGCRQEAALDASVQNSLARRGGGRRGFRNPWNAPLTTPPKYYATRSSKNLTNLLSGLKIFLLVVLPHAVVLFDFDYFGECILLYYYSRQITHFWSKFLSPTRSLRLYLSQDFCGVTESWQQRTYLRNVRSSLSQRVLYEPLPVLHDFYTCTWVSTNQRCLLPLTRECCESEAAFVFSRMLGKFVKQFEYTWIFLLPLPSTLSLRFLRPLLITTREICSTMAETSQRVLNFSPGPAKLPEEVSQWIAYNFSVWSISS